MGADPMVKKKPIQCIAAANNNLGLVCTHENYLPFFFLTMGCWEEREEARDGVEDQSGLEPPSRGRGRRRSGLERLSHGAAHSLEKVHVNMDNVFCRLASRLVLTQGCLNAGE